MLLESVASPGLSLSQSFIYTYLNPFLTFLIVFPISRLVHNLVKHRLSTQIKRSPSDLDYTFLQILESLKPGYYFFASAYIATLTLDLPHKATQTLNSVLITWTVYQLIQAFLILIDYAGKNHFQNKASKTNTSVVYVLKLTIKIGLWAIGAVLILSNLGINVTSLIAGLGIGGIAVAFAVQGILEDLFSSIAIYFDRPFSIGDTILVEGHLGTVKKIGIKTTRLKSLQGEEIIISNQKLTTANIQNFKLMKTRRISFSLSITYKTPIKKLKQIPLALEKIISQQPEVKFDRAHLKNFAESHLEFEIVYHLNKSDYNLYMDTQQTINFQILEYLNQHHIDLAYPTHTIYQSKL